jgi:ribosomal protein L14
MDAKYKVGELVIINRDNEMIDAEVFGVMNNNLEKETFYSIRVGEKFFFLEEDAIIKVTDE